jgi:hypothetical protein
MSHWVFSFVSGHGLQPCRKSVKKKMGLQPLICPIRASAVNFCFPMTAIPAMSAIFSSRRILQRLLERRQRFFRLRFQHH